MGKYACEKLSLCPCALCTGVVTPEMLSGSSPFPRVVSSGYHAWNVVWFAGQSHLVDCMNAPGELFTSRELDGGLDGDDGGRYTYHRTNGRSGLSIVYEGEETQPVGGSALRRELLEVWSNTAGGWVQVGESFFEEAERG